MTRPVMIAGAQIGGIARNESRKQVVARLIALLRDAHARGAELVVFPELTLTTFFPRWWMEDQAEINSFFETEMPSAATRPLFEAARELERRLLSRLRRAGEEAGATRHYNTAILVGREGQIVGKYRKVHLPGHADHRPHMPYQHLEKRYFDVPTDGFGVWDFGAGKYRHGDLQRPALAGDLSGHGAQGRRGRDARLQHADPHPVGADLRSPRAPSTTIW